MLQSCPRALQGVERVVSGPEGTARISEEQTGRSEGWNLDQGPGQDAAAAQGERGAVANMPVQASGDSFAALLRARTGGHPLTSHNAHPSGASARHQRLVCMRAQSGINQDHWYRTDKTRW